MGVTQLWSVLQPVKKKVLLRELHGQCLAVDLGFWICEMQFIQHNPMSFQTPYLRTLYFRLLNLAQQGIRLIFVIDGPATDLKIQTITKRFKKGSTDLISEVFLNKMKVRKTFRSVLKQCTQLLDSMGIPHIESEGEGEKMCALLNMRGICDGVITNDGDAFLYGARKVYRNLCLNCKEPYFEVYEYETIKRELSLTREHFIAYALLVGCDYNSKGI